MERPYDAVLSEDISPTLIGAGPAKTESAPQLEGY